MNLGTTTGNGTLRVNAGGFIGRNTGQGGTDVFRSYADGSSLTSSISGNDTLTLKENLGGFIGRMEAGDIDDSFTTIPDNLEFVASQTGGSFANCWYTNDATDTHAGVTRVADDGGATEAEREAERIANLLAVVDSFYTHAVFDLWDFSGRDTDGTAYIWDVEGDGLHPTLSWE